MFNKVYLVNVGPKTGHEGPKAFFNLGATSGCVIKSIYSQLYPGKDPVPNVSEARWASGPVWAGAENLVPPPGFDTRTVQP